MRRGWAQERGLFMWLSGLMFSVPPQLSSAVTDVMLACGWRLAQYSAVSSGKALITGPVISSTVMIWFLEVMLDRKSVAWGESVDLGGCRILKREITSASLLMGSDPPLPSADVTHVLSAAGHPPAQLTLVC